MKYLSDSINKAVAEKMNLGQKELVSPELGLEALTIVKRLKIRTREDVMLFCAAMNLLNTYVKQPGSDIGYFFKIYINRLFAALLKNDIPGIKVGMDIAVSRKGSAIAYVIVQIDNVQFSFHQIKMSDMAFNLVSEHKVVTNMLFDGMRKQMCAVTVFEMVKNAKNVSAENGHGFC
ncbi:MAG: hypothetical protein K6G18_03240 [Treponema sp.]|nr:hypothetical protein [Treponema sp.]